VTDKVSHRDKTRCRNNIVFYILIQC
jgi:hypothetical protein